MFLRQATSAFLLSAQVVARYKSTWQTEKVMGNEIDRIEAEVEASRIGADVAGLASMALRFARRAKALERAVDAAASGGVPRDKLHAWLSKNAWTMVDEEGVFVWRRGDDEFLTFGDYYGLITLLRDVKGLAGLHGRSPTCSKRS